MATINNEPKKRAFVPSSGNGYVKDYTYGYNLTSTGISLKDIIEAASNVLMHSTATEGAKTCISMTNRLKFQSGELNFLIIGRVSIDDKKPDETASLGKQVKSLMQEIADALEELKEIRSTSALRRTEE